MYTIYLAGSITIDPKTYLWRQHVRKYYQENRFVKVIDPCTSEFNLQYKESKGKNSQYKDSKTVVLLPRKDRHYVRISNVIFADLNVYTKSKPLTGTLFELAWAFDDPSKMVIGIFKAWIFID